MDRYLIVANQTLADAQLAEEVSRRIAAGACSFHIVVPAAHPRGAWTEGGTHAEAQRRLDAALEAFAAMGADVTGEVGDASPVRAVGDVLIRESGGFDGVIVSTLPLGVSKWIHQDVVHRMGSSHHLPVVHVERAREHAVQRA